MLLVHFCLASEMTSILESLIGAVLALLTLTMHDESGFSFGMAAIPNVLVDNLESGSVVYY